MDRNNIKLAVVAVFSLVVGLSAPAVSEVARQVTFAQNSDKVDGKHAVGSGASVSTRKGKLVATNTKGRLPNNIISKAPNADKLDGVDAKAYRFIPLQLGAGATLNDSTVSYSANAFGGGGLVVPNLSVARFGWGIVLPPDFPTGGSLTLRLLWHTNDTGCQVDFQGDSMEHSAPGVEWAGGHSADGIENTPAQTVPAEDLTGAVTEITLEAPSSRPFQAGDGYWFSIYRLPEDTCPGPVYISGASLTY